MNTFEYMSSISKMLCTMRFNILAIFCLCYKEELEGGDNDNDEEKKKKDEK